MSAFYGTLQGNRGQATRMGSKESGVRTQNAGWGGCVAVQTFKDDNDRDCASISLTPWSGSGGPNVVLYIGPIDAEAREKLSGVDWNAVAGFIGDTNSKVA